MGKKQDKRSKKGSKKVVLSLAEFNEDAGLGGVDPELAALPSAPKPAEEWEAEGGRPEYNSRGYKERTVSSYRDRSYDADAEFDERDWSRKGPLEDRDGGPGFGLGGPDRDWGDMRRGPVDAEGPGAPERDWNDMRRGPVESNFQGSGGERDWSMRKGPIEAELPAARTIDDSQWGSARKMTIDADFSQARAEPDWSARKPVEAEIRSPIRETDWSAPRKGPIESEFSQGDVADRDWSMRKGPIEADVVKTTIEADWSDVRKGPIEADVPKRDSASDWGGARKGPVEADAPHRRMDTEMDWSKRRGPVAANVDTIQKGVRDVNFDDVRRGSKLRELNVSRPRNQLESQRKLEQAEGVKDSWRGASAGSVGQRALQEPRMLERPASTGHDDVPKDRDWGAARRSQPLRGSPRLSRPLSAAPRHGSEHEFVAGKFENLENAGAADNDDDDWTTVRNVNRRSTGAARRSLGRDSRVSLPKKAGTHGGPGEVPIRSRVAVENSSESSHVAATVTSTGSES